MPRLTVSPLFTAVLLLVSVSVLRAEPYLDSAHVQSILQAQEHLLNDRFDQVDSIYREHINERPIDPAGYLFRAGGVFARMIDREENLHGELFKQLLDTVDLLTSQIIDTGSAESVAWMYLFRGHARAYRSLYESRFGSLVTALKLGLSTIDEYEAGLENNGRLYDLYAGIGSYHYWKSAKAGILKWLGIFKDERDEGIAELRLAADSSLLHRELARSALIWIWLDRKEYDSAAALAREFSHRHPDGKMFLWPLGQALFCMEEYQSAAAVFARIRTRLESFPGNYYNLIQCDYHLTQCYNWLSDPELTKATAAQVNEYYQHIPGHTLKRQRAKLNFLTRIARR